MSSPNPKSSYFKDKKDVKLDQDEVIVFSCLKNEEKRIPYFLDYYRNLGVKNFFIIDNDSIDNSGEILKSQPDVHYFHTSMSYKGSSAGRLWLQELAEFYGINKWCLTVDVDELLVYPGIEYCNLNSLCNYLDIEDSQGLFCVFLDLYSNKPLNETIYTPGEPFTDVCSNFDADSYVLRPGMLPPNLGVFGGPRGESFLKQDRQGPMMKKVPLVKYSDGFSYIFSTHSHKNIRLSKLTGSLLHFKFFEFFADLAKYEAKRGDRRQQKDYAHYADELNDTTCFFNPSSFQYQQSSDLVRLGIMVSNQDFKNYCVGLVGDQNPGMAALATKAFPKPIVDPPPHSSGAPTIRWMNMIWPFANNRGAIDHVSNETVGREFANRRRFLVNARSNVKLIDVRDSILRMSIPEDIAYRHNNPKLSLLMLSEGKLVFIESLDFSAERVTVDEGSLVPAIYKLDLSDLELANSTEMFFDAKLYLVGDEHLPELFNDTPGKKAMRTKVSDHVLGTPISELFYFGQTVAEPLPQTLSQYLRPRAATVEGSTEMASEERSLYLDGVIERVARGEIGGWVRAVKTGTDTEPELLKKDVSIYINGRYCGKALTNTPSNPDEMKFFRFKFKLPLEYFFEREEPSLTVECRIARHNFVLRRSPIEIESRNSYKYDIESGEWIENKPIEN